MGAAAGGRVRWIFIVVGFEGSRSQVFKLRVPIILH